MSTPSGKPFKPTDPSYDTEQGGTERRGVDESSTRSPYAPKRVRGGFISSPIRASDQPLSPPQFLLDTTRGGRVGLTDFTDTSMQFGDGAYEEDVPSEHPAGDRDDYYLAETRSSERAPVDRRSTEEEEELRRLEESVRLLQAASKATRGPQPAPAGEQKVQRRRGETLTSGVRVPPSLQPQVMSAPPDLAGGSGWLRALLMVSAAMVIAAPVAYYFTTGDSAPNSEPGSDITLASAPPSATSSGLGYADNFQSPPPPARSPVAATDGTSSQTTVVPKKVVTRLSDPPPASPPTAVRTEPVPPPMRSEPPPMRSEPTPPPAREQQPVVRSESPPHTRTLAPEEIELLVKQGQEFAAAGDFVTSRIVFQRAAEAGNAVAALAMGASYDPVVLASLGARGVEPDVNKARVWYQRAKDLGLAEASRRLDLLANR